MSRQEMAAGSLPSASGPESLGATLRTIFHVNGHLIRLAVELSQSHAADRQSESLAQLGRILKSAEPGALDHVSRCPFLLVEAGFRDPARWIAARDSLGRSTSASDSAPPPGGGKILSLARSTMLVAWHVAQLSPLDADLVLGATADCAAVLASLSLPQMEELAERHSDWVRPRWELRLDRWERLVRLASTSRHPSSAVARCALSLFRGELSGEPAP